MLLILTLSCSYKNLTPGTSVEGSQAQLVNMRALITAERAYDAAFDQWIATEPNPVQPVQVDGTRHSWGRPDDFDTLGWAPDGDVTGSYWITVSDEGFEVNSVDWHNDARVHCTRAYTLANGMDTDTACAIQ